MNRAQYRLARKVLQSPGACSIVGRYISKAGGQWSVCGLGALAIEAGVNPTWFYREGRNELPIYSDELYPVAKAISGKFGLSRSQQEKLQAANDKPLISSVEDEHNVRVKRVLDVLKEIYGPERSA